MLSAIVGDTSKSYAFGYDMRHPPVHRQGAVWPTDSENRRKFERYMTEQVVALRHCWEPSREFPITRYYHACEVPGKNFCRLAILPDYQFDLSRSPLYMDRRRVTTKPKRKVGWFERQLDKLIAWREAHR